MEYFDNRGWRWRQQANGAWARWTGSAWVAPDAGNPAPLQMPALGTPGRDGSLDYNDQHGNLWTRDKEGHHFRWTGSTWLYSDASPDFAAQQPAPVAETQQPVAQAAPPKPVGNLFGAPGYNQAQQAPAFDFKAGATWGNFNQMQRDYFNEPGNAAEAEDLYFRSIGLTGNALEYAKRQASAIKAKFANDSFAQAGTPGGKAPLFTDWLGQGGSANLVNGYNMLSARSRGANPGAFGTGRMMF